MGNSQIISPVLLESNNIQYKLFYLNFSKDGSIYLFFPRNKGYTIRAQKDIVFPVIGETTFSLDNTTNHFDSPYISFHPKNKVIHVNDKKKLIFKLDTEVLNLSENKDILSFPMCQIIFPISTDYLDKYMPKKEHVTPLNIYVNNRNLNVGLSIEAWIHPVGTYLDPSDLPLYQVRKIVNIVRFSNVNLTAYTCTLVICEITTTGTPRIIISVFNNNQPYIFELSANI